MRRSIRSSTCPPGQTPPCIWIFEDCLVQIPSPWGKKAVQMPHQLVLNYLSSKANFVFNQHCSHFSKRDRCRNDKFKLLLKTLLKELFINKGEILFCKSVKPCKNRKNPRAYYVRTRDKSGSNFQPFQRNVQIPPSLGTMHSQMPGGDVEVSNWSAHYLLYLSSNTFTETEKLRSWYLLYFIRNNFYIKLCIPNTRLA